MMFSKFEAIPTVVIGLISAISAYVIAIIADIDPIALKGLNEIGVTALLGFFAIQFFRANKELATNFTISMEKMRDEHSKERKELIDQMNRELAEERAHSIKITAAIMGVSGRKFAQAYKDAEVEVNETKK